MSEKFVVASNNAHKIDEFKRILSSLDIEVISAREAGVDLSSVEETGKSFAANAALKALYTFDRCGLPCIADDSGLCVDALNGRPGIYSARYGGENSTDDDKIALLLAELSKVDEKDRTAYFTCSICCILGENDVIAVEGRCSGSIGFEKIGENGFGYDPVFIVDNGKTFAELTDDEKDLYSHRGNALRKLHRVLEERKDFDLC